MNFINFNNDPYSNVLSALGVNMHQLKKSKNGNKNHKQIVNVDDVIEKIRNIRAGVMECDADAIEYICSRGIFKKETILKGIYCYRNNICEFKLETILRNDYRKRMALIERIDLILHAFNVVKTRPALSN